MKNFNFSSLPKISTERLLIRPIKESDAKDIFDYASNPVITKFLCWDAHKDLADTKKFIQTVLINYAYNKPAPWGVIYKENNKLIGTIGFDNKWDIENKCAELGYALSQEYWNKGLMTEAVTALLNYIFQNTDINRIEALIDVENIASQKICKKVGMEYEGTLRKDIKLKEEFKDMQMYSILRK